jgi:hypothetical protein
LAQTHHHKQKHLQDLRDAETNRWSRKSIGNLVKDLTDVVSYGRRSEADFHHFKVQMIKHEPDYVHVVVSINDDNLMRSFAPPTRGFIVHRDGRVEK